MVQKNLAVVLSLFFVARLVSSDLLSSCASKKEDGIWVCHETGSILYEAENSNGSGCLTETRPNSEPIASIQDSEDQWISMQGKQYQRFASMQIYLSRKNHKNLTEPQKISLLKKQLYDEFNSVIQRMNDLEDKCLSRYKFLNKKLCSFETKVESALVESALLCTELREVKIEQLRPSCCECKKRKSEYQFGGNQDEGVTLKDIQAMKRNQQYADA